LPRRTLNLGILAHVDAGKTSLTERLLYTAGVIDAVGSVDAGTTQTDSLALEQQRGITIRAAVVAFAIDDLTVNLIDTPGHPDFIAEVERVLGVLDGAVLVVSAVEGVQAQTRILMRALQRLRIPTLLYINKVDRRGADVERVCVEIADKLTRRIVALNVVHDQGMRTAGVVARTHGDLTFRSDLVSVLAEHDEPLLASYLGGRRVLPDRLRSALVAQTAQVLVHTVFCGSAITGAGVDLLLAGIRDLLPARSGDDTAPLAALVFKIERGPSGQRVAYIRVFSGTLRIRDRVRFGRDGEGKVTALTVFEPGGPVQRSRAVAGEIAKVSGLDEIRIGDSIGDTSARGMSREFLPPTLESVVEPVDPGDRHRLHLALTELAEQDPLIDVRRDDQREELSISLYGEVQKEVIEATLLSDYGLGVSFHEATPIYVERPSAVGEAVEILHAETNPFLATVGLRVEPGPAGSGVEFRLAVDARTVPLFLYKTLDGFHERMRDYVTATLAEGLYGWRVTAIVVTMTRCTYSVPDGPPSRRGPLSTAADFRKLTPIVLMQALAAAGTAVCEPMVAVDAEVPAVSVGGVIAVLARLGATVAPPAIVGELATVEASLSAIRARELRRRLPGLTRGEGVLETTFAGYEPVAGTPPTRARTTASPLELDRYLSELAGHGRRGR
jgi:ribosomal protection tetracycline resistance protein